MILWCWISNLVLFVHRLAKREVFQSTAQCFTLQTCLLRLFLVGLTFLWRVVGDLVLVAGTTTHRRGEWRALTSLMVLLLMLVLVIILVCQAVTLDGRWTLNLASFGTDLRLKDPSRAPTWCFLQWALLIRLCLWSCQLTEQGLFLHFLSL